MISSEVSYNNIWSQDQVHAVRSTDIMDSETSFTFSRKLLFTASQNLITSRSRNHTLLLPTATVRKTDLWEIKPPDFSPKLYRTLSLPRIKKKTLNPAILKEGLEERSQSLDKMPSVIQSKQEEKRNIPVFITSYKPPGLLELHSASSWSWDSFQMVPTKTRNLTISDR